MNTTNTKHKSPLLRGRQPACCHANALRRSAEPGSRSASPQRPRLQVLAALAWALPLLGATATLRPALAADTTRPTVAITTPTLNSTQPLLALASGTARDAGGVARVTTLLYRYADAARGVPEGYFNGDAFLPRATSDCYRAAASSNGFATWRAALPPLRAGRYALRAFATDRAGLPGQSESVTFSLSQNAPLPDSRRLAVLKSLEDAVNATPQADMNAAHAAILARVKGRPEFEAAGIAAGYNVWARFLDGRVLMIAVDNTTPAPTSPRPRAATSATTSSPRQDAPAVGSAVASNEAPRAAGAKRMDLPDSLKAHVLSGFGPFYEDAGLAHEEIKAALLRHGYVDGGAGSTQASVTALKAVLGDGVFYINSHGNGATLRDGTPTFGVYSTTPVTDASERAFKDDLDKERLCYMIEKNDYSWDFQGRSERHYGILPDFVRRYWNFSPRSLVYINTCMSFRDFAADFALACYEKKAGCYVGWDNYSLVTAGARAARYFFDRALGDNAFEPESPAQRAFDIVPVLADMDKKKLRESRHPRIKASLHFRPNDNGDTFGILAPSIKRLRVDERTDTLTLSGLFGDNAAGKGELWVGGRKLAVKSWEQEKVTATIPRSGVGSSGAVVVAVGGRKSNIVPLTEWNGQILYDLDGHQSLEEKWVIPVRFRADAHLSRDKPGEAPKAPTTPEEMVIQSMRLGASGQPLEGSYVASGYGEIFMPNDPNAHGMSWAARRTLANNLYNPAAPHEFGLVGFLDAKARKLTLDVSAFSQRQDVLFYGGASTTTFDNGTRTEFDPLMPEWPLPLDESWSIPADEFGGQVTHPTAPQFPAATYTWRWETITATTPPPAPPYPAGYAG